MRVIAVRFLLAAVVTAFGFAPALACTPWPNCAFESQQAKDQSKEVVEQAKDSAAQKLLIFNRLNVLDVSDEIVGSADIRALVGSYAYFEPGQKTLRIIGANFEGKFDRIQLKDRRLFEGVVKRGFDSGISIGVLKVGLRRNQVAELVIDDIAFASIEAKADVISCNFPVAFREEALTGRIRPVFIKSAAISRIRKRYFTETKLGGAGTYLFVSADGKYHVADDTSVTHFVITPQVVPAMPANAGDCTKALASSASPREAAEPRGLQVRPETRDNRNRIEIARPAARKLEAVSVSEMRQRLENQAGLIGKAPEAGAVISVVKAAKKK